MNMDLKSKIVFITGGAGGLGKTFATFFLTRGCKVAITDVDEIRGKEVLTALQKEYGTDSATFLRCDVTSDHSFQSAYNDCEKHFGTVDILINNAGISSKDWKKTTEVNYGGVIRGTEIAMKKMSKKNGGKGGHVINIGSTLGVNDLPHIPFYSASKAGVVQYSRTVGHSFHSDDTGVVVQCLCPDGAQTELVKSIQESCYSPESWKAVKELYTTVTFLKPESVAKALFKLLEDQKPGGVLVIDVRGELKYIKPSLEAVY